MYTYTWNSMYSECSMLAKDERMETLVNAHHDNSTHVHIYIYTRTCIHVHYMYKQKV